ncbi:bifunctional hydroxymethylpyrimidine kinase/phosphomethylpyrimidine kinase [Marinimicrobium alkaliphilum]|uniref:bifunctional hydroxymethylpyrimidine kinase/phosphomethylpyrimidine kinase n=1 Tax=Marinimicrobium alkaliphilum TaxID=2202654 RepID=UPI000DB9C866|nr:hydroxymethylpyrimidine/phosphomethylpyrimidine kinase [Marinimicrobium alkaliphilum]
MASLSTTTPIVLSLSSHDPSGSSGIQADIEACISLGCHCTPVISALCARDTRELKDIQAVDALLLVEQVRAILEDMPVDVIKLGFIASAAHAEAMYTILQDYPNIPLILDPVTHLGSNQPSDNPSLVDVIKTLLLPRALLATPDLVEARELAPQGDTLDACAQEILHSGCEHLLITGTRRDQFHLDNTLYNAQGVIRHYRWDRINAFSHGCGATLSAAISAYLAHGLSLMDAVEQGQTFTWRALHASRRLGSGRCVPNRLYWAERDNLH